MSVSKKKIKLKDYESDDSENEDTINFNNGYERLTESDDVVGPISVIIFEDVVDDDDDGQKSYNGNEVEPENLKTSNGAKSIKISLSQEQIKNNNLLKVPEVKKGRSASFTAVDKSLSLLPGNYRSGTRYSLGKISSTSMTKTAIPTISTSDSNVVQVTSEKATTFKSDKVIYDVPRKHSLATFPERKFSNLNFSYATPIKSLATIDQPAVTRSFNLNFRHPESFYCKICNNILTDPRVLSCFHSFCFQCLVDLDRSNSQQSNQFWRKVSENSDSEWNFSVKTDQEPSLMSRSSIDCDSDTHVSQSFFNFNKDKRSSLSTLKSKRFLRAKSPMKHRQSSIISFSEKPKSIVCPICESVTELSVHGIFRLPQNMILARKIREFTSRTNFDINKITCHLCTGELLATSNCLTCGLNLCSFCKEAHRRQKPTSNHDIKPLIDRKSKKSKSAERINDPKVMKCSIHPSLDLKLFCTKCHQVICSDCTILVHRGHKITSVTKASKVYIKVIKDELQKTRPVGNYAIHSISKLNDLTKKLNAKCMDVECEVESFLADYFQALEVHKKTLLNQIARARESKMDMIRSQQEDLERRSNEAKTVISFTEELLNEGNDLETMIFFNMLLQKFQQCRKNDNSMDIKISDSLQFLSEVKAPSNSAQNNIPLYGIITTQTPCARNCVLETTEGLSNLRVNKKAELILLARDTDDRTMCHGAANVEVEIRYRDVSFKKIKAQISDKRDGTYIITFLPDVAGVMHISIYVNGKPIRNSPFTVRARNLRPHSGIYHCCAFCSSKGAKNAICACNGTMSDDFDGCGHGWEGHPGHRHWSCCGNVLENSECSVANAIITDLIE